MSNIVDLRSDTVTRPVPGMRRAMAEAVVGDDVFGDDPTVIQLEERVASLFGTQSALFVPSGTMGNQIALAALCEPGDEVILERYSHVFNHQVAAASVLSGLQLNPLDGDRGVITAAQIAPHVRPANIHQPVTRVISIENTHNRAGGRIFPIDEMRRIKSFATSGGMKVHLDGARLANAVVASGVSFKEYVSCADTVSMCFSKGLGAPVGSIVAGDTKVIERSRRKRKQFGGGMRQAGILAAAALYALDHHVDRLEDDHTHARRLAEAVSNTDGLDLVFPAETNIVVFSIHESLGPVASFMDRLKQHNILASLSGTTRIRMVTHLDVHADDISRVIKTIGTLGTRGGR
jgi:threonine aldolase